jgi:cobalt-zinc-cadmium efflux system protein
MHDHHHPTPQGGREEMKMYSKVFGIYIFIIAIDVIGGRILTNSTALVAEAGHVAIDSVSAIVSIISAYLVTIGHNEKRTRRIGFLLNMGMLWSVAMLIGYEAIERFEHPQAFSGWVVIIAATISLCGSLVAHRVLDNDSHEERTETHEAQHLHVWADIVQSAGVILAGLIMIVTGSSIVDPIMSALIALWMASQTILLIVRRTMPQHQH